MSGGKGSLKRGQRMCKDPAHPRRSKEASVAGTWQAGNTGDDVAGDGESAGGLTRESTGMG